MTTGDRRPGPAGVAPRAPEVAREEVDEVLALAQQMSPSASPKPAGARAPAAEPAAPAEEQRAEAPASVRADEVGDVIGIASEITQQKVETVSLAELQEIGRDVNVPEESVAQAVQILEERKRQELAAAVARRKRLRQVAVIAAVTLVLLTLWGVLAQSSLRGDLATLDEAKAHVRTVLDRQAAVVARLAGQPSTSDRDAELSGAENRVRIEQRRYDEAAGAYNARAASFPNSLWIDLFGLPGEVPLSNAITTW